MLKIRWFGHSMWRISDGEITIVIDPFDFIGYPLPEKLTADILICSHQHHDHNNISLVKKYELLINQAGHHRFRQVDVETIQTDHDEVHGQKRGKNLITIIRFGERKIIHCGDLGALPDKEIMESLKQANVLMVPVGGVYTLDDFQASELVRMLQPQIVLPMHYRTPHLKFDLNSVDHFKKRCEHYFVYKDAEIDLDEIHEKYPFAIQLAYL